MFAEQAVASRGRSERLSRRKLVEVRTHVDDSFWIFLELKNHVDLCRLSLFSHVLHCSSKSQCKGLMETMLDQARATSPRSCVAVLPQIVWQQLLN